MFLELVPDYDIANSLTLFEPVSLLALVKFLVIAYLKVDCLWLLPLGTIDLPILFRSFIAPNIFIGQIINLLLLLFLFLCQGRLGLPGNEHVFLVGGLWVGFGSLYIIRILQRIFFISRGHPLKSISFSATRPVLRPDSYTHLTLPTNSGV